ncbi:MAG: hypothetical protein H0V79_08085 [Actinobacteria bacterium]|nr:hypothetical protein [Actinomycetota bacterium]
MALSEDIERVAAEAAVHAAEDEAVAGVLAAEPLSEGRVFLCAFEKGEDISWLALDESGKPVTARERVREVVSLVALCEVAEESAGGGELDDLLSKLVALRVTENPPGIDEAEEAVLALQRAIGSPPRVATLAYLDEVGSAAKRLESALGGTSGSPFADAMQAAAGAVQALTADVEATYKTELV